MVGDLTDPRRLNPYGKVKLDRLRVHRLKSIWK